MFINDGKSLFGHIGVIISLCILCILLFFSYNKCLIGSNIDHTNKKINTMDTMMDTMMPNTMDTMMSNMMPNMMPNTMDTMMNTMMPNTRDAMIDINNNPNKIETFYASIATNDEIDNSTLPVPKNVRISVAGGNISVNFTLTDIKGVKTPNKILVVLAQYDANKKNTGNNKFNLSNEYELTSSVAVNQFAYQTNLCSLVDNVPKCQYMFKNIDISDSSGNLYYYKIGVSAMYDNNYNTPLIMPYNVKSGDKLFTINESIDKQNANFIEFIKSQSKIKHNVYDNTMSTADGKYELLKAELGNYPDNLLIDELTVDQNLLTDLLDKTMAHGIINIDVKMNEKSK